MTFQRMLAAGAAISALVLAAPSQANNIHFFPVHPVKRPVGVGDMLYYGGSVFSDVKVVSVLWNKNVVQNTKDQIPLFSAAIVDSTYLDQLIQYKTKGVTAANGHSSTNQKINRGTYIGQFTLKPHNKSANLTDANVQKELKAQIKAGNLPARDLNTFYMIYFPANIHIEANGAHSCVQFGAYHSSTIGTTLSKKNVFYSVEPECNQGIGSLTVAASHEFSEALTDNVPTPGSNPDYPQAWNDIQGFEVGDKCEGRNGTLTSGAGHWAVQQEYLNSLHGCSTTATYTSP
jgi:hypothetical protein